MKTDLGTYDGTALKWFDWIGLFKSLVRDTGKSADEKLAILRRYLRGDCQDIVYGLGGGEPAYKEALLRLRETCGRMSVMRAALLHEFGFICTISVPSASGGISTKSTESV